jgi:hypothetical protein
MAIKKHPHRIDNYILSISSDKSNKVLSVIDAVGFRSSGKNEELIKAVQEFGKKYKK